MKRSNLIRLFLFVTIVVVCLSSCATVERFRNKNTMYIMVYDYENRPVHGMKFYVYDIEEDNLDVEAKTIDVSSFRHVGESDVNGRFLLEIDENDNREHFLKAEKYGYNTVYSRIVYSKTGVLYIKTGNVAEFLTLAESSIDSRDYLTALDYIDNAESIEGGDDILYLKAIVLKALGRNNELINTIARISPKFKSTNYIGDLYEKI